MATNSRFRRRVWRIAVLGLLGLATCCPGIASAQHRKLNGRLQKIGPFRVIRVWGSPEKMGFAHGYLVGKDFVADFQVMLAQLYPDDIQRYEKTRKALKDFIKIPPAAKSEIKGVFDGISALYGAAPKLELLKRRLVLDDVVFYNSIDALRAFGCSGFTVWGDRAGEVGVISGRNFDYPAFSPATVSHQSILVRQPTDRHEVATITWPGYIGAFTGFNDEGVAIFLHDGTGRRADAPNHQFTPTALIAKDVLERSRPGRAARGMRDDLILAKTAYSYMVRVVTPWVAAVATPELVLRADADGPSLNPNGPDWSITTNHYLSGSFGPATRASDDSLRRFSQLRKTLKESVTDQIAWQALSEVAAAAPDGGTLHSLVYFPEQRRLELSFATWKDTFKPATMNKPVTITFDELFDTVAAAKRKTPGK